MTTPAVYSARPDGLGARLTSLLTAMRVAELLDEEFKFTWTGISTWRMEFRDIDGHAIAHPHDFFGKGFADRHLIDPRLVRPRDILALPELSGQRDLTVEDLRQRFNSAGGLRVTGVPPLEEICTPELPPGTFRMRDCFDRIGFSDSIRGALDAAKNVDLAGPMTAFHLRGGDLVYGKWRKTVRWTYKSLPIPVAKSMIEWALVRGSSVVCFGTDSEVLDYLCSEYGVTNGSALSEKFATGAERAMFEIGLMSRASEIVAGTSHFAKVAAILDKVPVLQPEEVISWKKREAMCMTDLAANADTYNRFQTAFAYWYLYYDGRRRRSSRANIEWLDKAHQYDPENALYPLVKAALLYKIEADDEAERVVEYALAADIARGGSEVFKVLGGKTKGEQNLREFQPHFRQAWQRGLPFASVLHAVTQRAKGNVRESQRILKDPRAKSVGPDVLALIPAD